METADQQRDILKNFYSIIKSANPYIRFFLVTGVSKFSRVSLFSDLNNLEDITLIRKFATLTGYTQEELYAGQPGIPLFVISNGLPDHSFGFELRHIYPGVSQQRSPRFDVPAPAGRFSRGFFRGFESHSRTDHTCAIRKGPGRFYQN
ncbi:MAG: AAA family ATPase [Lewinellaceae bacterium]|nr:AAA family ATPase [Lewinellaceae bacterium]